MPVLHIIALAQPDPRRIDAALAGAALAIAEAYGCKPEQVWVTWQEIKPNQYVEGSTKARVQPRDTHPPLCELLCFEGKTPEVIEATLGAAADAITTALEIPGNVFMTYRELPAGRVIAGDGIVRR